MQHSITTKFFIISLIIALFICVGIWLVFHLTNETKKRIAIETKIDLEKARGIILHELTQIENNTLDSLMSALKTGTNLADLPALFLGAFVVDFENQTTRSFSDYFIEIKATSLWQPFYQLQKVAQSEKILHDASRHLMKNNALPDQVNLVHLAEQGRHPFYQLRAAHLLGLTYQRQHRFDAAIRYLNIDLAPNAVDNPLDDYLKAACLLERIHCYIALNQFDLAAQTIDLLFESLNSETLAELDEDAKNFYVQQLDSLTRRSEIEAQSFYFSSSKEQSLKQWSLKSKLALLNRNFDNLQAVLNQDLHRRSTLLFDSDTLLIRLALPNSQDYSSNHFYYPSKLYLGLMYDFPWLIHVQIPRIIEKTGTNVELCEHLEKSEPNLSLADGFETLSLVLDSETAFQQKQEIQQQTRSGFIAIFILTIISAITIWSLFHGLKREQELIRLQSDFIAAVTHDLKTPLTLLKTSVETLIMRRVPAHKRKHYFQIMWHEANWLAALVENILDFSRLRHGKRKFNMERIPIKPVIDEVVFMMQRNNHSKQATINLSRDDISIYADRVAIRQVLFNLLDNAFKFGPETETILINVTGPHNKDILIEIVDKGPGVPKDEQKFIFDDFRQGRLAQTGGYRGSGLGLALVRRLVTGMGGKVGYRPNPDGGSIFYVKLSTC